MQKLSKYVCHKVIIGKEKRNCHRLIVTAVGPSIIPTTPKCITRRKSGPTPTDRKAYSLLRDYMVERYHESRQKSPLYDRNESINFIETSNPGRREILHHRKDVVDIVHIDRNIFTSLKNVLSLIDRINTRVVQNGLAASTQIRTPSSNGMLQTRAVINEKEYLFCVEVGEDSTDESAHLRRNSCPEKFPPCDDEDLAHLKREIQGLDFFALSSLLRVYQKIVRKKYDPHEGNLSRAPFPFNRVENFILKTLCSHIDNLLQRKNNRKGETVENNLQETPSGKAPFRAIYWEVLNILQSLTHNKGEYIDVINRVLYAQFKIVDKHRHHYNYAFSVALLPVINEVLLYQSTRLGSPPTGEGDFHHPAFFATIGGNPLHMQKEAFTWGYIEENYQKGELSVYRSGSPMGDEQSRNIDTPQNSADLICPPIETVQKESNPPADVAKFSYLQQYSITLLSIIAKKIKYMEKRNHVHDLGIILEGINTLLHVRSSSGEEISSLINRRVEFLKDVISKDKDHPTGVSQNVYLLVFLDFIFNFLKNVKFRPKSSIPRMTKKGEYLGDHFLKILCLCSSIRQILTSGIRRNDSRKGHHQRGPSVVCTNDAPLYADQASKLISRVNKNIGLLISEVILNAPNYGSPTRLESSHLPNAYMAYLLNDVYLQSNSQVKKMTLSHFVKKKESSHWGSQPGERQIYLEYITLHNFVKIFKGDINQAEGKRAERRDAERKDTETEIENSVEKVFPFFRTFLENCTNMHRGQNDATEMSRDHQMKQLLHGINKLCYFYALCKRHITNANFVALANCNFYFAFSIINCHIEKCLNRSGLFFPHFVNMCVQKISVIVGTLKCFGLPAEEDLANCLSKFITLTHLCMTEENRKSLLLYVLPYVERSRKDVDKLEQLLMDTQVPSLSGEEGKDECTPAGESKSSCEDAQQTSEVYCGKKPSSCTHIEKSQSDDTPLRTHQNLHQMEKRIAEVLSTFEEKQISPIESKKMYELLNELLQELRQEHVRGSFLLRKENQILRNKLNYILLNFDSFIKTHITEVVTQQEWLFTHHDDEGELAQTGKGCLRVALHPAVHMRGEATTEGDNNSIGGVPEKDVDETAPGDDHPHGQAKLGLHFDYGHVSAKNEYFRQLQKYEREDYQKINNVLINMYLCNPYICSKSKDVVLSSGKSQKRVIILPQDTYRNIHKLFVAGKGDEGLKLMRRVHSSVHLFFIRVKFFFSRLS
ncbi:hypothetical protein C922_03971 [Plasmodium inui San Antonio 1]|uniref:Uncharacterized protein n=1 Tax=Plasmodium inui San Antonio 1 TaxID=1237626 RepID=W7A306_9APIC|nr:hypothetical protein C922_03971 [Plasmodium inui San Antonio 1]EUD65723.1 hypothetical protein C922_03971 [Plasmodium inui San Antonio 1]